ncbi:hypothetical protein GCM10028773_29140 [Spirosoma koreense]
MNDALSTILTIADQLSALRSPNTAAIEQFTRMTFKEELSNAYYQFYGSTQSQPPFSGGELRIPRPDNLNKPTILLMKLQEDQRVTARQIQQRMNAYPTAVPPSPTGPAHTYQHVYRYQGVELSFELSSDKDELKQVKLSVVLHS